VSYLAKKYAKLLIETVDLARIPSVIEEIRAFSRLIDSDRKLRILFTSQIFSDDEKTMALKEALSYIKAKDETQRFLALLVTHRSLGAIKEVIASVLKLYQERINTATAEVISPVPLNEQHLNKLRTTLSTLTKRDVRIDNKLDPSLIGGFIVRVDSTVYDSSLKGQLMLLRAELTR